MKKLLLFIGLVVLLSHNSLGDERNIEEQFDYVYSLIKQTYEIDYNKERNVFGHKRPIKDSVHPYKIKFCKLKKDNSTFTVLSNQSCITQDRDSRIKSIKIIKGKKISRDEYFRSNPDFSEKNNLICIMGGDPQDYFKYHVLFITHTPSNKVYLNSFVEVGYMDWSSGGSTVTIKWDQAPTGLPAMHDMRQKGVWLHQGVSESNNDGYVFEFYRYYEKNSQVIYGNDAKKKSTIFLPTSYGFTSTFEDSFVWNQKCYADDEYWTAMYPNISGIAVSDKSKTLSTPIITLNEKGEVVIVENLGVPTTNTPDVIVVDAGVTQSQLPKCKIVDQKVITKTACYGTITWANGDKYVGEFKNTWKHGLGTLTTWGNKYVGEFKDGKKHGQGTLTWPSGIKYVGEFKDDDFNGQGTLTSSDGIKYVGEYRNGEKHGQGTYTWPSGNKYVGEYKDGIFHGQGTYTWASGNKYVGEYKNGKIWQGTLTYAGGRIKSGEWKNGKLVKESDTTEVVKLEPEKTTTTKKKTVQTVTVEKDITGPKIIVKDTFTADANLTATVKGRVEDDSVIASLIIDGDQVSFTNGNFSQSLYVTEDREVIIAAIDKYGNSSNKIVLLKRGQVQPVAIKYEPLDPRKIKSKINNNAVALIIGVEDYENTFKAAYAKQDAILFNDFAHKAFGVPQYNIKLLTNSEAGRSNALRSITNWLPKIIKENKTDFYLFFSGHGLASSDGKDLFLLPYDGYPDTLEDSALLRNKIFEKISDLNPRSVTVFLDTCYSGATRSDEFLVAAKPIFIEVAEQEIPNNFTVFSASSGKETAKILKEAEHGLFSYFLMKGLEGEADANSDKKITSGELHAFINNKVSRQASQTPQLAGDADRVLVQW